MLEPDVMTMTHTPAPAAGRRPECTLPAIGFLADLDDDQRARLAAAGQFVARPNGALLSVQGRQHHAMALILAGRVSITVHARGDTVQLGVLEPGDVVGEMSILDPRVASSTARVVSDEALLWIIERDAFDDFVDNDCETGLVMLKALGKVLCRRVRADSERMLRTAEQVRGYFLDMDY